MNRRTAPAHIGSRSSTGLVSGGTSRTASRCVPVPILTLAKSLVELRRSQIRRSWVSSSSDGSARGSGLTHSSASRWAAAILRTRPRTWPR